MSSAIFAALPASSQVFLYDADGDAVMTDAITGLPIGFAGHVRARSDSLSTESLDDRPSKRSRSSSEESDTGTLVASPVAAPAPAAAPAAPKKEAAPPREEEDEHEAAMRNLSEAMAAMVLDGEPRDGAAAPAPPAAAAPPGGDAAEGEAPEEGWCVSVTCHDLALRLDMRHPRVVLNLLRFVKTYNELAPEGEDIHLPVMTRDAVDRILNHESVVHPVPEFADEIAELSALVQEFSCECQECSPYNYDDDNDSRSTDSYPRDPYGRDW
jgi:hypothetical protein